MHEVVVLAVGLVLGRLHRNVARGAVVEQLDAARELLQEIGFSPRRQEFHSLVKGVAAQFEANLVVALREWTVVKKYEKKT